MAKLNPLEVTLQEAKDWLKERVMKGERCPCCNQFSKVYRRKLNGNQCRDLIRLFQQTDGDLDRLVHISNFSLDRGGDFAKLAYWGFATDKENEDDAKRTSGLWKITSEGIDFVIGVTTAPKYIYTYNGADVAKSDQQTTIQEALGKKFNYAELMGFTN